MILQETLSLQIMMAWFLIQWNTAESNWEGSSDFQTQCFGMRLFDRSISRFLSQCSQWWVAILSSRLSETGLNRSKLVVLCMGIGLHIIKSLRGGRIGGPRYQWAYHLGYCILCQCGECMGTGKGTEKSETYLLVTADTNLGENSHNTNKICVFKWWRRNVFVHEGFILL